MTERGFLHKQFFCKIIAIERSISFPCFTFVLFCLFVCFFNRKGEKSRSMRQKSPSATEAVDEEHTFEEDTKL